MILFVGILKFLDLKKIKKQIILCNISNIYYAICFRLLNILFLFGSLLIIPLMCYNNFKGAVINDNIR